MPHATINGARLFYDEAGRGEPIIFHHGYNSSHDGWVDVVANLRDRYRCIWMDCRGAGDSEHAADGYRIAQFADDVIGLADLLGLGRFTYCGHSMGGAVGMELGGRYADRLDRLILVAPASACGIEVPPDIRERGRQLWSTQAREQLLFERSRMSARPLPLEVHRQAIERLLSVSERHFEECLDELINFRADLTAIQTPTLMVAGAADSLLQPNLVDFLQLPNATLHVFSRVGHGIPREVPDELAAVIADFCEHGVVTAGLLQARLLAAAEEMAVTGEPLKS